MLHKHHLIIRVGAGLIQFVYGSNSRLAADLTLDKNLFSLPFSRAFLVDLGISTLQSVFFNHTKDKEVRYLHIPLESCQVTDSNSLCLATDGDGVTKVNEISADLGFIGLQVAC